MNRMALSPTDAIQFPYSSADIESVSKGLAVAKNMDAFRGKSYYDNSGNQVTVPSTGAIDLGRFRGAMSQQAYLISPPSTFEAMRCIAYANGVWLIGGNRLTGDSINNILRSTDGFTWTAVNTPPSDIVATSGFCSVMFAYGNSVWVACGSYYYGNNASSSDYNTVLRSTDNGITWAKVTVAGNSNRTILFTSYQITYGNGIFIINCVTQLNQPIKMYSSTNGSTWTNITLPNSYYVDENGFGVLNGDVHNLAYGNGVFLLSVKKAITGYTSSGDSQLIASTDGTTWVEVSTPSGLSRIIAILYNGSSWYMTAILKSGSIEYFNIYTGTNSGTTFTFYLESIEETSAYTLGYAMGCLGYGGTNWVVSGGNITFDYFRIIDKGKVNQNVFKFNYRRGQSIAYGNNMFIQVNRGSSMMIINPVKAIWGDLAWTPITENPFAGGGVNKVAWNGSYFVAVGHNQAGTVSAAKSFNGISWTTSNPFSGPPGRGYQIVWNGSYWLAGGYRNGASIFMSTNGTNWTSANDTYENIAGMAWNGSYWLIVSNYNGVAYLGKSFNGIDWSTSVIQNYGILLSIATNGSYWLIGCYGNDSNNSINIIRSTNGVSWTPSTNNPFQRAGFSSARVFIWNGSYWLAGGSGKTTCSTSTDGMNWSTTLVRLFNKQYESIEYLSWNGSYWVAVGSGNTVNDTTYIAVSADALTWYPSSSEPFNGGGAGNGIAWNGTYFVMVGSAYYVFNQNIAISKNYTLNPVIVSTVSYNTLIWNRKYLYFYYYQGPGGSPEVTWNGSYWLAYGREVVVSGQPGIIFYKSSDGINWTNGSLNVNMSLGGSTKMVWNGSYWLLLTVGNFYKSSDGLNWNKSSDNPFTGNNSYAPTIGWNGSYWLTMYGTQYAKSFDGITWTIYTRNFTNAVSSSEKVIAWNGSYWLIGGTNNIIKSFDGINWTGVNTPFASTITDSTYIYNGFVNNIRWNGSYWLACGSKGASIAKSYDGELWTGCTVFASTGDTVYDVAWNGSYWVAVGLNIYSSTTLANIAMSYDGLTWTRATNTSISIGWWGTSIATNGSNFMSAGNNPTNNPAVSLITTF